MRARSVASNRVAYRTSVFSARRRRWGAPGRSATDRTITSACSGDTVPATIAARVRSNGPVTATARRTSRRPSPRRSPHRWVSQSPVDP